MGTSLGPEKALEGTFYRPNYSLENYQNLVQDWVNGFSTNKPVELKLDLKKAQNSSWSQYGFNEKEAENNLKSWPLMTTFDGDGEGTSTDELDFTKPGSKVEIKITYRGLKLLDISPGVWYVLF